MKLVENHTFRLGIVLVGMVAFAVPVVRAAEAIRQIADTLFVDDLYTPTIPVGTQASWVVNTELLKSAALTGEVSLDASTRFEGKATLKLRPAGNEQRASIQWTVDVEPGRFYAFSAAYRSAPRRESDPPAVMPMYGFINLEWYDANGARIPVRDKLVSFPSTDSSWTRLKVSAITPPGAVQARIGAIAGWHEPREDFAAWFGDFRWEHVQETPLVLELSPRILQTRDERQTITVRRLHPGSLAMDARLDVELIDRNGKVHRKWRSPNMMTLPWTTEIELPKGQDTSWSVRASVSPIRGHAGFHNWSAEEPIFVANSDLSKRFVDQRFVVDGKKRFLLAAYHAKPQDFAVLKEGGFNTMLLREYDPAAAVKLFDQLRSLGLYGTASVGGGGQTRGNQPRVQQMILALKDHPSLLAFDLMDEPTRKGVGPRQIAWYAQWVQSLAPQVPTTMNECGPYVIDRFASTVDVFSVDPYPVYTTLDIASEGDAPPDLDMVTRWMTLVRKSVPPGRPYIGVVECFTFDKAERRPPTGDEVRNMVYQTVASGVAGVVYYSVREPNWYLPDEPLFQDIKALNKELADLEPWLVTRPLEAKDEPVAVHSDRIDRLVTATWRQGDRCLTILINLDREPHPVRLESTQLPSDQSIPESITLAPLGVEKIEYQVSPTSVQAQSGLREVRQ